MTISNEYVSMQEKTNNKSMQLAAGGIGLGAVGGTASGYFLAKPWMKNGRFSDQFIKSSFDKIADINLKYGSKSKDVYNYAKESLKFAFTPNQTKENYIEFCKKFSKELNVEKLSEKELVDFIEAKIKEHGSIEEIQKTVIESLDKSLLTEFSNVKKGILKPLENVNAETEEIRGMLKGSITKMKKIAAIKWGLIGACLLGLTGLIIGLVSSKKGEH